MVPLSPRTGQKLCQTLHDRLVVTAVMFKLHSEMRKVKDKKVKDKKAPISDTEVANLLNNEEEEEIFYSDSDEDMFSEWEQDSDEG